MTDVTSSTVVACVVMVCATVAWIAHEAAKSNRDTPCVEEVHQPSEYFTRCNDPRAKIVSPPGWTWFKCECPGGEASGR